MSLRLWPAECCLVSELALKLAALDPDVLAASRVVLPTKRLRTWLLALLAQHRKAFVPPKLTSLDELVGVFAEALTPGAAGATAAASTLTLELLLASLLRQREYVHLKAGHAHEIQQLFAELDEWGLAEEAYQRLEEVVARDVVRSEPGLDTLSARFRELEDLAKVLRTTLGAAGLETREARTRRLIRGVTEALAVGVDPEMPGPIFIVGFSSLGGHHREMLQALGVLPSVEVWLSEPPTLSGARNPLAELVALFPEDLRIAAKAEPTIHAVARPTVALLEAETVLEEVEAAVGLVLAAVAEGLPPSHAAILVTDDAAYGTPLRQALAKAAFATNAAIALPLASTDLGGWLTALQALLTTPESPEAILDFLAHPLSAARWTARHASVDQRAEIASTLARLEEPRPLPDLVFEAPEIAAYVVRLGESLAPFFDRTPRRLEEWAGELSTLILPVTAARPATALRERALQRSAREQLEALLQELKRAARLAVTPISPRELARLALPRALDLDVRDVGDQLAGVQVLSVAEARYVPFRLLVILGAVEGSFPRALPKDHLVDGWLKTRIGLPGWQLLEAIEDTTFHLLVERVPSLTLSYPQRRGADPVVRSRFVEDMIARGIAKPQRIAVGAPTLAVSVDEMTRALTERWDAPGVFPKATTLAVRPMSATAIEALIRCPYRHLLERLGVRELGLPRAGDDRREGDQLHEVLEAFFTGRARGRTVAEPLTESPDWTRHYDYCLERLGAISAKLMPASFMSSEGGLQLSMKAWPAFAQHLLRLYDPDSWRRAAQGLREHTFHVEGASVAPEGASWTLGGSIDAVDRVGAFHLVTDYKRGGAPDPRDVKDGIAAQLPVYAAALAARGREDDEQQWPLEAAVLGYWRILEGEWIGVAAGSDAKDTAVALGLVGARSPLAEELVDKVRDLITWRESQREAEGGRYVPDPSRCGFCRLAGICRRDDPQATSPGGGGPRNEMALAERLAGLEPPRRSSASKTPPSTERGRQAETTSVPPVIPDALGSSTPEVPS